LFHVPASIAADCSADVTPALVDWLRSVPDNSTIEFSTGACYRIDETVELDGHRQLLLAGNGATFKAVIDGDRNRRHFLLRGDRDITIRDLTIVGSNPVAGATPAAYRPDREAQHAVDLESVHDVLLEGITAHDLHGDFVYVGGGTAGYSDTVVVAHCNFSRSGRQGISITGGQNVLITANQMSGVPRSMFDLEPTTAAGAAQHVRIINNTTGAAVNFWFASKGEGANVGDVVVTGNVMQEPTGGLWFEMSPVATPRGPFEVADNVMSTLGTVTDAGAVGAFFFAGCQDVTIRANHVVLSRPMPAVEVRHTHTVVISGNSFVGASQTVLSDGQSTGVTVG
jgi:hypothetical protein